MLGIEETLKGETMTEPVNLIVRESIAELVFNRPDTFNSLDMAMVESLEQKTQDLLSLEHVRAVVLRGEGKAFMSGGDVKFFHDHIDDLPARLEALGQRVNRSVLNLQELDKPILACVHGAVAGIGMSFMMAADLVLAGSQTKFTMAYTQLGVSPDGGASHFLPLHVGTKKAMELLLLSERIDAQQALQLGLINWVVAEEDLYVQSEQLLQRLANGPTRAYATVKQLLYHNRSENLQDILNNEIQHFAELSQTQDFKAGVSAFVNKEKPHFTGQ